MTRQPKLLYLIFSFLLLTGAQALSQTITISTPTIGFTQACASPSFNTYNFSFSFFPPQNLGPDNQFIVELSDNTGSFASPTIVQTLTNTTSPVSGSFNLPENTYGESYKIRVRSTNPVKTSGASNSFAAYYAIHNQPFSINNNAGTIQICEGETVTLQIDNDGTPSSPLYYPSLNYIWYKDFIEIPGETGPSITVSESGSYYVITDYGTCVLNSYSNIVQVQVMETLEPSISSNSGQTQICPGSTVSLESNIQDAAYNYTWFKDESPISGANDPVYEASEEGVYHLEVANGPCIFETNAIALDVNDFSLSLDPASTTVIIPGESIILTSITDAESPSFQWFKNGEIISGAIGETFDAEEQGTYKAVVTQMTPCSIEKESEVIIAYPEAFSLTIEADTAYNECASETTTLSVAQFDAETPEGIVSLINNTYNYTYQWYKDGNIVSDSTTPTLLLDDSLENGSYALEITVPGYGVVTSNAININLAIDEITIAADSELCEGSTVLLSSSITDSFYTYQWYKNGIEIIGANSSTITADSEGDYYVELNGGTCSAQSNIIILEIGEITVTASTPVTDVILPGEEKILLVTTDAQSPAFTWSQNGAPLTETSATLTATEDGVYTAIVTQTQGCPVTAQVEFTLEYPTSFTLTINNDAGYETCVSEVTTLSAISLTATTSEGNLDASTMNYTYQWYWNDVPVTGANLASLTLENAGQNGAYKLGVTIPEFGEIFSNTINVDIAISDVAINNDTELCEGSSVLLSSSTTDGSYTYQWYKNAIPVAEANTSTLMTDSEGDYHLVVTSGGCSEQSNTITLEINEITVTETSPVTDIILPGEEKILSVTTDASSPAFAWSRNGLLLAETSASLTANEDGEYTVTVTQTQGCNATAQTEFTLEYPTGFALTISADAGYVACTSSTATLSVASLMASTSEGPIDALVMGYPLQWYKDDVVVTGANTASLALNNATQNGVYKLGVTIPGFGEIISNNIAINLPLGNITITNSSGLCEGSTVILSSGVTEVSYSYQWYKNDVAIAGAINPSFTADSEGVYHLVITGGECISQSNSITLEIDEISVTATTPLTDVILPGEEKILTVTTDAQSPIFAWSRNSTPLAETSTSLTATEDGEYTVTVTQTEGCSATADVEFSLGYPTSFSLAINTDAAYEDCVSTMATLTVTSLTASTSEGSLDALAMDYPYQWYKDDVPVTGANATSLSMTNAIENGVYKLGVTIPQFGEIFSNNIIINLAIGTVEITSSNVMCEGTEVVLSSDVANGEYTYQWYKSGTPLAGADAPAFTANAEGEYYLVATSGSCSTESNTITLEIEEITVNTITPLTEIILPGEEKILSVTTDAESPSFAWARNDEILSEASSSLTAFEDGEYVVVVTQTEGCNATGEATFTLQYPSGFELSIGPDAVYEACNSSTASLSLTSFTATTPAGDIDATAMDYAYQWYKNDVAVPGANILSLALNNALQNGVYKLGITIPEFGEVFSNTITVSLNIGAAEIAASGTLCPEDPAVVVTSNIVNSAYTYTWFHDGTLLVSGNNPGITAAEAGEYFVTVDTGECLVTSNTIVIEEADFDLTSSNPITDIIINGQTKEITVTTDALSPQYTWYRNDEIIAGANGSTLYATLDGEYKVFVTQTEDCSITKELLFTLIYPSAYEITIAAADDYEPCVSSQIQLMIVSFEAITPNGPVLITEGSYDYQWYYNNESLTGAVSPALTVENGGAYHLEITVPDFGSVISNVVHLNPGIPETFNISTSDTFCSEGSTVTFSGNLNGEAYSYEWYEEGNSESIGNENTFTVSESGSYYALINYGDCTATSNTIELIPFSADAVIIDVGNELGLLEGTTATITASGAETYTWYLNGNVVGTGPSVEISTIGTYSLIATVGECEVKKQVTVTIVENNIVAIPNVVTPNNDGINDTWSLPLKYMNSSEVEVVIYGPDGAIVYRSSNYRNNWPESGFTFSQKNPVYYYTIMEKKEITKRGSITIITN